MTFTVSCTSAATWPAQGDEIVLVVAGDLTGWGWPKLAGLIAEAEDRGVERVTLDLRAVSSCDREALFELVTVRGRWPSPQGCVVDVVGVRRMQFLDVLEQEPLLKLHDVQVVIGDLCGPQVLPIDCSLVRSTAPDAVGGLPADGQVEPGAASSSIQHPVRLLPDHLPHDPLARGRHRR